jgi:hypothetical protein
MFAKHGLWNCFSVLTVSLFVSGCATYKPKSYIPPSVLANYSDDVESSTMLQTYNNLPEGTDAQKAAKAVRRNQILRELIALIDHNYSTFEDRYYGSDATVNFGGDVVNLGLTGVSTVTGTAHLKSVLSAIATGTTGIKTSYEKNFFDQQTRAAVVQKMRAGRATQLALMQDQYHMKAPVACPSAGCPQVGGAPVAPYSLETGLSDVEQYYQAGTVIGALQAIAMAAGSDQADAATKQTTNSMAKQLF